MREEKAGVEELVEEDLEEEGKKQNGTEVEKDLQVEEEGRGVEAGAEAEAGVEVVVVVILSKKLDRSRDWPAES